MATTQKLILNRFNGTDWDVTYVANSADISYMHKEHVVVEDLVGFTLGNTILGQDNVYDVLTRVVNYVGTLSSTVIPDISSGDSIESLDADKIAGIIDRSNLPADIGGVAIQVDSEEAKDALTGTDVNIGDIVAVDGGMLYLVNEIAEDGTVTFFPISDNTPISFTDLVDVPTTLEGYGITDAIHESEAVTEATANKLLYLDDDGSLPTNITGSAVKLNGETADFYATAADMTAAEEAHADLLEKLKDATPIETIDVSKLTGIINIENIPHAAIERCMVVADDAARFALTIEDVQVGDTVKVNDTEVMYFVVDDTQLGVEDGYAVYSAGVAASVAWSGVTGTPTTLDGYGITDAVYSKDFTWDNLGGTPESTVAEIDAAVATATHANREVLDELTDVDGALAYAGDAVAFDSALLRAGTELPTNPTDGMLALLFLDETPDTTPDEAPEPEAGEDTGDVVE